METILWILIIVLLVIAVVSEIIKSKKFKKKIDELKKEYYQTEKEYELGKISLEEAEKRTDDILQKMMYEMIHANNMDFDYSFVSYSYRKEEGELLWDYKI